MQNLISFAGLFVLIGIAWMSSTNRRLVHGRLILWAVLLQLLFGLFVFVVPAGVQTFLVLNTLVVRVLDCASAGTRFVFGRLALGPGTFNEAGESSIGFILAFQALPSVVFFASLMGLLYYVGIMPRLIRLFARLFERFMRISGAEALAVASNIFVGVESATTIRPYLRDMTRSELCTVITAGMATIASSVMGFYTFILQGTFPTIAGHLVSASILSAPAAILMSKLLYPEDGSPVTLGRSARLTYERESSLIEAIIAGANAGLRLVGGILALLLALLGLVALVNLALTSVGGGINSLTGWHVNWSLEGLLGYLFYPLTLIIGVPHGDAVAIARIIGERVVLTEVKSYQDLSALLSSGSLVDPGRSSLITVYALCGFAHVASLAIFVGGTAALAPERTADLSRVGVRALIAATLACLMTACVAGVFYVEGSGSVLFPAP